MNLDYNKRDSTPKPISDTTVSASEYNQIAASLMNIIIAAGLTPDASDNNQLLEAINPIGPSGDYVVESKIPTAQDLTWYRVWKSGWVEQGGRYTLTNQGGGQGETITLPKEMADTNYIVLCGPVSNTDNWPLAWCPLQHRTTTTINLDGTGNYTGAYRTITIEWEVKGQGATNE